jgi:hypothetical protein
MAVVPPLVGGFADHLYGISRLDDGERWSVQAGLYIGVISASIVFIGAVWSGLSERGSAIS